MMDNVPVYIIEIGRNKSSYKVKYAFTQLNQAYLYYNAINIGNGYKKRLRRNNKVLERYIS